MGNTQQNTPPPKPPLYEDFIGTLEEKEEKDLRENFKMVNVHWVDEDQVSWALFADKYFETQPDKTKVVKDMVEHFETHRDKVILTRQTNYLCNKKEQLCICNIHANDFRKIYAGQNFTKKPFVVWVKKGDDPF